MKRNYTWMAAAALLALAGCSREPLAEEPGTEILTATIVDGAGTRTTYDGDTGKFSWQEGDEIAIYQVKEASSTYKSQVRPVLNPTTDRSATFVYSKETGYTRTGYAVYPAAVAKSWDGSVLTVTLPSTYAVSDATPLPLVAVNGSETADLPFLHTCGLLRIKCDELPESTVTVTLDKGITGDFVVSFDPDTEDPSITAVTASDTNPATVTFTGASTTSATLDLPLPCGAYTSISVTSGGTPKTVSVPFTVTRGVGKKVHVSFE